jgi:hypothetical protein
MRETKKMRKEEWGMYVLLLEVLHYLDIYRDPCINVDINKIVYVWGSNL